MAYAGEMEDKGKHSMFGGNAIRPEEAGKVLKGLAVKVVSGLP